MAKYDIEDLCNDLKAYLLANLDTKIAAVEAEKIAAGKPLDGGLPGIPEAAYTFQNWSDAILQNPVNLFFGVEDVKANDIGAGQSADVLTLFIEVVLVVDSNKKNNDDVNRVFRYTRAIKEVMQAYAKINSFISKTKIETVRPVSYKLNFDTNEEVRVGGVSVTTSIA